MHVARCLLVTVLYIRCEFLQILTSTYGKPPAEKRPTCMGFPLPEKLRMEWEKLRDDNEYLPGKAAFEAGLRNDKWYRTTDSTSIYFIW